MRHGHELVFDQFVILSIFSEYQVVALGIVHVWWNSESACSIVRQKVSTGIVMDDTIDLLVTIRDGRCQNVECAAYSEPDCDFTPG